MKTDVMGIEFDNLTMDQALHRAKALVQRGASAYCVTPNAEIAWEAIQDPSFREILNDADLVLPDGAGVLLGAKILGHPIQEKVAGIDFASRLAEAMAKDGGRLYLLGGKPGIAQRAGENLQRKYPGLRICGTADGYFQDEAAVIQEINAHAPDVLFVCLGSPKQERFMATHQHQLKVGLMIGLGGSLDGFAGEVKRAPKWMIRCNLEWLYRLMKDPKRLRRMMRLPKFILACQKAAKQRG